MYVLENNVAWTDELKNAFKHGMTRASIIYTDDNNTTVTLNENNNLSNLTLDEQRYISGIGFVGTAAARKLELEICDINNEINLENKELTLKIGADYNGSTYYINYGNFIVDSAPEHDETNGKTKIVAYDYMIKFNKPYDDQVNYPCTLLQLLQNICSQAGVTLETTDIDNRDFSVTDNQFEGATLREVLQNIAKCAFSWARIGQDNKLYLDFFVETDNTETLTIDDYKTNGFKKAQEYYGPINRVIYADSDIEGQEEKIESPSSIQQNGLHELVIYDNLFAYTPEKRQELIIGGSRLFGLTYMPVSQLDSVGLIYIDANDSLSIETLDESTYSTRPFNHKIQYSGATSDSFTSEGESGNEQVYKNTATDTFQNQKTRAMVDRANKRINLLASDVADHTEQISEIEIDLDGIETKVSSIYDLTRMSSGSKTITLENCMKGYILELHIYGNNSVFKYLYPADDLYPSDTLYPYGDSRVIVTDKDGNETLYTLGITDVLRANDEVKDEYILKDNYAKIIRRVNADGTTKVIPVEENLGVYTIYVEDGNNTITIKNYTAKLDATYIIKNSYTNQFATMYEMNSAITQTAEEINTEVRKKVGEDEVISKINQSAEQVKINAGKISLERKRN